MNDDNDADADVVVAIVKGMPGREGRGRIVLGKYDDSTILVLPELFLSSSSIAVAMGCRVGREEVGLCSVSMILLIFVD